MTYRPPLLGPQNLWNACKSTQPAGGCSIRKKDEEEGEQKDREKRKRDRSANDVDLFKCTASFKDKVHKEDLNDGKAANPFAFYLNDRCCQMHNETAAKSHAQVEKHFHQNFTNL